MFNVNSCSDTSRFVKYCEKVLACLSSGLIISEATTFVPRSALVNFSIAANF